MEDKIEIREYIRTTYGNIYKLENEDEYDFLRDRFYGNIAKHSKNIIDLIQVGDYVNGYKVSGKESTLLYTEIEGIDRSGYHVPISQYGENIKSIVTKEQFAKEEYRLED